LKPGYAPFCKHFFVENFTNALVNYRKIEESNQHLIRTRYEARRETELPVLIRWFPQDKVEVRKAKVLDIILYSREQIMMENSGKLALDSFRLIL
jgi:hypothetical protein